MNEILERWGPRPSASKRRRTARGVILAALAAASTLGVCDSPALAQVQPTYLYSLSSFAGTLRYDLVRVRVDQERDEVYVIYQNLIRVFNASGMEIFAFGDDLPLGQILDAAVDVKGDVILLSYKDSRTVVTRCNFRGVPVAEIPITRLPDAGPFTASRMVLRNDLFYFVTLGNASVIVTDVHGEFRKRVDLPSLLDAEERKNISDAEAVGFNVDGEGNMFFTIPALFKVYKVSPDGKLASFGRSGSAPGRFGVLAGIAVDSQGNVIVADKLKCAIIVFDKDFNLLTEFGYRGAKPGNLINPDDIDVDRRGHLYVSQGRKRGVSVFSLLGK